MTTDCLRPDHAARPGRGSPAPSAGTSGLAELRLSRLCELAIQSPIRCALLVTRRRPLVQVMNYEGFDPRHPDRDPARSLGRDRHVFGLVWKIGCLGLIVLTVLGWAALNSLQNAVPGPRAFAPQVRLSSQPVVLTQSAATISGLVTVRFDRATDDELNALSIGLSLGLPEFAAGSPAQVPPGSEMPSPVSATGRALFSDPLLRLTVVGRLGPVTCAGPCELQLEPDNCQTDCKFDFGFRLELVPAGDPLEVRALLTAAAAAWTGHSLPAGLDVELTVAAVPPASGG